jgi:hypothetical protein
MKEEGITKLTCNVCRTVAEQKPLHIGVNPFNRWTELTRHQRHAVAYFHVCSDKCLSKLITDPTKYDFK